MLDQLIRWDKELLLWLNSHHTLYTDSFFYVVTNPFTFTPLYIFVFWYCYKRFGKRILGFLGLLGIQASITALTCIYAIKNVICRLRPINDPEISAQVHTVPGFENHDFSFVSAHSANTFGIALFLSLIVGRRWFTLTMCTWSFLMAYSRIALGAHFPLDILGGLTLGCLSALVMRAIQKRIYPLE